MTRTAVLISGMLISNALAASGIRVERLPNNPIITPVMYKEGFAPGDTSIIGASVIRVPSWVSNPLGKYYLYCAHHHSHTYIDMFYAEKVTGPYTRYLPGVLHMKNTVFDDHISYPDVRIDEEKRVMRMYFHGDGPCGHVTSVATSNNGLAFTAVNYCISGKYNRVWKVDSAYYAYGKGGGVYRSTDPMRGFVKVGIADLETSVSPRHGGVRPFGKTVYCLYSAIGDAPERIKAVRVADITAKSWAKTGPFEVLRPEMAWEGARLPVAPSTTGESKGMRNQLRDPNVFTDIDGQDYLLYGVAGENGIAIAKIYFPESGTTMSGAVPLAGMHMPSSSAPRQHWRPGESAVGGILLNGATSAAPTTTSALTVHRRALIAPGSTR